jgi:TonB family protein
MGWFRLETRRFAPPSICGVRGPGRSRFKHAGSIQAIVNWRRAGASRALTGGVVWALPEGRARLDGAVAQLDRASVFETEGCGFEPRPPRQAENRTAVAPADPAGGGGSPPRDFRASPRPAMADDCQSSPTGLFCVIVLERLMTPRLKTLVLVLAAACGPWTPAAGAAEPGTQPIRVLQTTGLKFPVTSDTFTLSKGQAQVLINVDADGKLVDWLVLSYTQSAFADAAVRALQQWRFEPARVDGRPVGARQALTFDFQATGNVVSTLSVEMYDNFVSSIFGQTVHWQVCPPHELDEPLQALKTVRPKFAGAAWQGGSPGGRVVLDFYVDQSGRPRMPVVVSTNEKLFAAAAVDALRDWRFSIPRCGGRPVAVRVEQAFVFAD